MNIWKKLFVRSDKSKNCSPFQKFKVSSSKNCGKQKKPELDDVHSCKLIANCETASTDAQYCYKLAEKLLKSAKEEVKHKLTVSDSNLTISPKKKIASKSKKTFRRFLTRKKRIPPLKRTTIYNSSFHNGSTVIKEPFIVAQGNDAIRTGRKIFSSKAIAFCNILGKSPETLFIVCQSCLNFKSFVYVFRFSDSLKCKMFHSRVKRLFKIEEENFKTKARKRFSCPLWESCNYPALKTSNNRYSI